MDPGMLHGLTSLPGRPRLWTRRDEAGAVRPKLTAFVMNERCSGISPRSILAFTRRCFGSVTAFTTTLIGTIANRMASFLTSTGTSLLSWKLNSDIPFAPGSKFGLYMSLWCEEFLDRIGNMLHVKSPPTMTQQSYFPNLYTISPAYLHYSPDSSEFTLPEKGN